jgi:peptide/nickel transport system permease protein
MGSYIAKSLLSTLPTLLGISVLTFSIVHFIPGDPITVMFGQSPDPLAIERLRSLYGFDRPLPVQYVTWLSNVVTGNMGVSIRLETPIVSMIVERLPRTIFLTLTALLISVLIALPAGLVSAYYNNTRIDFLISGLTLVILAIPSFWVGILLIIFFSRYFPGVPLGGYVEPLKDPIGFFSRLILPSVTLGLALTASTTRVLRSATLEILGQDYIRVSRAKGLGERRVFLKHALRNALIPTVTIVAIQAGYLLGGSIIIERVFSYPGLGLLLLSAVQSRDYPLIQALVLLFAAFFVLVNLVTDLIYGAINPQVQYT